MLHSSGQSQHLAGRGEPLAGLSSDILFMRLIFLAMDCPAGTRWPSIEEMADGIAGLAAELGLAQLILTGHPRKVRCFKRLPARCRRFGAASAERSSQSRSQPAETAKQTRKMAAR